MGNLAKGSPLDNKLIFFVSYLAFEAFPLDFSEYLDMKKFFGKEIHDMEVEFDE